MTQTALTPAQAARPAWRPPASRATRRIGVVVLLPEPLATHVQAWRRALDDPAAHQVRPHITLVPPQNIRTEAVPEALALVDRVAATSSPFTVGLGGAATFLPESAVAYLAVEAGADALATLESKLAVEPTGRRSYPAFVPHVTVAQDLAEERIEHAAAELSRFRASFTADELVVLEQGRDGAWTVLHRRASGPSVRDVPYSEAASASLLLLRPPCVLLGLRTPRQGRRYPSAWDGLGGKPEPGELLLQALSREVWEEAGIAPFDVAPLGCFHDGERADAFYIATAWAGHPRNADPAEHVRLEWVPLDAAMQRDLPPTTRRALERLAQVAGDGAVPGITPSARQGSDVP